MLTPLLPSARGSSSRELGVGQVAEVAVAPCCCQQQCVVSLQVSCARCSRLRLLLRRVRGECGRLTCSYRGGAFGGGLAGSVLPRIEEGCRKVQVRCFWSPPAHLRVCVPLRLTEPACGVAFTSAGLLPVESVEGVSASLAAPLLLGCSVCRVASPVEHCDTCLWLLSAWRWLVVSSGEVLPEFFSIGSGGSEECSVLISAIVVLPQGLRYAASVGLAGAFWKNGAFVVLVEVLPGPDCVASIVLLAAVFSLMVCVLWSLGLCILVKVLPRIALCRFWQRFFPGVLCVGFGPPLCCPCVYLGVSGQGIVLLDVHLAVALASLSRSSFQVFSATLVGLRVPVAWMVCFISCALRALPDGGLA
ncbi:hypothetical protein Taro_051953 [Colocasia esculenta]|uniref:Uncharacterized protein n=1 Tax=Colocasia esculenta TaxID=4460 RepID=A0A843XIA2_COLES|nr:hypothetical protein [Colocasia esculenta]